MQVPRVYGSALDVYRQNNVNNKIITCWTFVGKIIPNPSWQGMRVSRVYGSELNAYRQSNYLNNS